MGADLHFHAFLNWQFFETECTAVTVMKTSNLAVLFHFPNVRLFCHSLHLYYSPVFPCFIFTGICDDASMAACQR